MSVRLAPGRLEHAGAARDNWGLAVVVALALAVSWVIFERVIRVGDLLGWDEAYHSLWGLLIADDLLHARFVGILVDTNRQVMWPPLHSWYLAVLFVVFGPSTVLARSSSLLAFMATAVIVYFTGRRLTASAGPGRTAVGGVVASACLIASGGVRSMASVAMSELPALFWLAVSFWLYLRCRSTDASERWPPILLGLAVLATYLTRTSYGVLIALALTIASLVDGRWLSRRRSAAPGDDEAQLVSRRHGHLLTALALGVPLAVWLAYPGKISSTLTHLINTPHGPERFSVEGLLFYPRAMLWLAGSWPLLVVWMLALVLTLRPRVLASNAGLRLVVVFLALQMLFAELAVNKAERFSLPLALGLSLLAGFWAGRCWIWLEEGRFRSLGPRRPSLARWVVAAAAAVLLAWQVYGVEVSGAGRGYARRWVPLLEHLVADLRRNGPCLLVVSTDLLVPPAGLDWHLAAAGLLPMEGAGALVTSTDLYSVHSRPRRLYALLPDSLRGQVDRWPGSAGTYTAYVGLPLGARESVKFSPSNFGERVAALLARHPMDRVLVILPDGSSLTPELVTDNLRRLGFAPTASSPTQIQGARASATELKAIRGVAPARL
jgi:4-amino-4-deoxy-L-arabinose transferase-like glycosyltransferase